MARIWSSGFELNSATSGVEISLAGTGTTTIDATTFRSGTYAVKHVAATQAGRRAVAQHVAANATAPYYYRGYINVSDSPSAQVRVMRVVIVAGTIRVSIRMNTNMTLELWNEEGAAQVGSDSAALLENTWYRLELKVDTTTVGSTVVEAMIDGVSFASGTIALTTGQGGVSWGFEGVSGNFIGTVFFDDLAINSSDGSFENSWPGEGEIIHLRPNANGDNTGMFADTSPDNYQSVDDVPPNDGTDSATHNTLNTIDDYNIDATPAAMDSSDTINCVQVGARFSVDDATGADPAFVLRIKASSGGTVEESAAITPTSTSWVTNIPSSIHIYPLTLYDLPGASTTAWTKSDLDTAQIGFRISTGDTHFADVTAIWLLVDHKPNVAPPAGDAFLGYRMLLGIGS